LIEANPALIAAVPAILQLIELSLKRRLSAMTGFRGRLLRGAVTKVQGVPAGEGWAVDSLLSVGLGPTLLNKFQAELGLERLRLIISGGAPLAAHTHKFFRSAVAPVAQGYGATESCGFMTCQECFPAAGRPADVSLGTVGSIMPCCEVKLRSVPEMGYLVTDSPPRGEILMGGNTVSQQGYFKMVDKSREDFPVHADGKVWFSTGDIGAMDADGCLSIIDRKKDIVKLSGGEFVSLSKVEATLKQDLQMVAVVVFAHPDKDHCVAIVSQPESGWGSVGGRPCEETLVGSVEQKLRSLGFPRFEIPAKLRVDDLVWTSQNGLLTAAQKIQRHRLRNHYNDRGGVLDMMDYRFPEH